MYLYTKGETTVQMPSPLAVCEARGRLEGVVTGATNPLKAFNGQDVWTLIMGVSEGVVQEFTRPEAVSSLPGAIAPELAPIWGAATKGPANPETGNRRQAFRIGRFDDEHMQRISAEVYGDFCDHTDRPVWHVEMPIAQFPEGRANIPDFIAINMAHNPPSVAPAWELGSRPGSIEYDKRLRWFARIVCRLADERAA